MKSLRVVLLTLVLAVASSAQVSVGCFGTQVVSPPLPVGSGQPAPLAPLRICSSTATGTPCSPLMSGIYFDPLLSRIQPNPTATDANGNWSACLIPGTYLIQVFPMPGVTYSYYLTTQDSSVAGHNLLSPTHLDTTPSAVAQGGIIIGQGSTAKWTQLPKGTANQVLTMNAAVTEPEWKDLTGLVDVGVTFNGKPSASGASAPYDFYLVQHPFPFAVTIPAGCTHSQKVMQVSPTSTWVGTLLKNDVSFGTVSCSTASPSVCTFTCASSTSFAESDVLGLIPPASQDSTGARIGGAIYGTR